MIIFLYGENDFRITQKIKDLEDKFIKEVDSSGQNIFKFDGEKVSLDELAGQISSNSLFSSKKMIIISDLIRNKQKSILKDLLEYSEKNKINSSQDIFIFTEKNIRSKSGQNLVKSSGGRENPLNKEEKVFYGFLTKEKYSQELKKFSQSELANFIKQEFLKYEVKIGPKEVQVLMAINNENVWNISNEIKKIAHFKLGEARENKTKDEIRVSLIDIEKISSGIFTENIFSFTDSISAKNTRQALKILEEQYLAGSEPEYILSMMLRQFKILLQIRELLDNNHTTTKIISALKLHPFIVNKGVNQAKNFESKKLRRIINSLGEIELENRKSQIDIKNLINLLVLKI